jgi:hypothetical protein
MADVRHAPEGQAILDLGSEDGGSPRPATVDPRAAGTDGTTSAGPVPTRTQAPRAEEPEPKGDTERSVGDAPRGSAAAASDAAPLSGDAAEGVAGVEGLAPVAEATLPPSEERASGAGSAAPAAAVKGVSQVAAEPSLDPLDVGAASGGAVPGDLHVALAQVERAARDWGIRADLMEGRFVSALMAAIRAVGEVSEGAKAEFREIARKGQEIARTEYQQAHELAQAANTALAQARTAQVLAQAEKESLVARMIKETLPLFAENLRNVLVLREQRWNRDRLRRRYALVGIVVLGIFLAGYGLRAWADQGDVGFAERCLSQPITTRGHVYCDMTALTAAAKQAGQ